MACTACRVISSRREAEHQARTDNLIALRDDLRDRLVPTLATTPRVDIKKMLDATEAFIGELTRRINRDLLLEASRLKLDDEPAGDAEPAAQCRQDWPPAVLE